MKTPLLVLSLLVLLTAVAASAQPFSVNPRLDRRAASPREQAGQPNTQSSFARTVVLPAGNNSLEFEYGVDSETGDNLEVLVGSTVVWSMSGLNKRGRRGVGLCSSGPCTIRFRYIKNASRDGGRDGAWIDNVRIRTSAQGVLEMHRFDAAGGGLPVGWTGTGVAGGFRVTPPPPELSVGPGPNQGATARPDQPTISFLERRITWPFADRNSLEFDYWVDSEPRRDFLRVLLNGQQVWSKSGRNAFGHAVIEVPNGTHEVRFEYAKNGSVDQGLDTVRLDNVTARSGGFVAEAHGFDGRVVGSAPRMPGQRMADWRTGRRAPWAVGEALPPRTYVPAQTPGSAFAPGWKVFSSATVDGHLGAEYPNPTKIHLRDYGVTAGSSAALRLTASQPARAIYFGLRLPAATQAVGGESGHLELFLDDERNTSLRRLGCEQDHREPGPEDRRIFLDYSVPAGSATGSITVAPLRRGTCSAGFEPFVATVDWQIQAAVRENPSDPGHLHLELRLTAPSASAAFTEDRLGLALIVRMGNGAHFRLPFRDDARGPQSSNVLTWETLELDYTPGRSLGSEVLLDGACCYPKPSRAGFEW
ncbi:MAG: hypothetical protein AAF560_06785 [Acidobacteriota bacterium]